jgi:DsbC/DsbD-like thiol-disulfide interchange protein
LILLDESLHPKKYLGFSIKEKPGPTIMNRQKALTLSLLSALLFCPLQSVASETASTPELKVSLISECDPAPQQGNFSAAIFFELEDDWHLYWTNPGDAGLAPKISWTLPKGITAGEIAWPFPHAIHVDAISNFGYSDKLLLSAPFTASSNDKAATLTADLSWLVCKDICIPGKATLSKPITLSEKCVASTDAGIFAESKKKIPLSLDLMDASFNLKDNKFELELYATNPIFRDAKQVDVFIENTAVVSYQSTQKSYWKHNYLKWTQDLNESYQALPESINAVIVIDDRTSYKIHISTKENPL